MMEAVRTSETSVDNHFTRQYNPEDSSEQSKAMLLSDAGAKGERKYSPYSFLTLAGDGVSSQRYAPA
jgi:hypothetical protein